ncbi:MAG: hypothetical protein R3B07_03385 [Polyangiaceae bacterium]
MAYRTLRVADVLRPRREPGATRRWGQYSLAALKCISKSKPGSDGCAEFEERLMKPLWGKRVCKGAVRVLDRVATLVGVAALACSSG